MSYLFGLTGVRPPGTEAAQLSAVGTRWSTAVSSMTSMPSDISASISAVTKANQGPTATAFAAAMGGSTSGMRQLGQFVEDGAAMGQTCSRAAQVLTQTALAMRTVALRGETRIRRLMAADGVGSAIKIIAVIRQTRTSLLSVESQGQQEITQVLGAVHFKSGSASLSQAGGRHSPPRLTGTRSVHRRVPPSPSMSTSSGARRTSPSRTAWSPWG